MNAGPVPSLFHPPTPRLFSIPPHLSFLDEIASAVNDAIAGKNPGAIADTEIYLPTRRAVRALSNAFLANAGRDAATLLPRIRAIGDIDEAEAVLFKGDTADELDLPPAISAVERRIALAQLVAAREHGTKSVAHWAGALSAADELASLIDDFYTEEIDPSALGAIAPDDIAEHWVRSLEFLEIVTRAWPAYLEEIGLMDPTARRIHLINALADRMSNNRPEHPVIIAGTTGSAPAVARLMSVVAALPQGCVVLPGLDLTLPDAVWRAVDDPHPQSGLKHLLEHGLGLDRKNVLPWRKEPDAPRIERSEIINVALRPAAATDSWRDWAENFKKQFSNKDRPITGFNIVEAEDDEREADAVAIKIREIVDTLDKTVFLITPDRDLSRRVAAELLRWNINVDDSAGVPFHASPCGGFLRLVARAISAPADPAAFVAMLRHPLFGGGLADADRAREINACDIGLRGLQPDGAEEIARRLAAIDASPLAIGKLFETICAGQEAGGSLGAQLMRHIALAETLAATATEDGAARLWRGEDGEAGAGRIADLAGALDGVVNWSPSDYAEIFDQLIADITVRRRAQTHPRIAILGPLEARLQSADVVILGGLNEGVWPRDAAIDGFLSRGMRKSIGLPSPERRIGLSAHDFAQFSAAPEVMLTRSKKTGGKPATPSRWIVRLKNILNGAGVFDAIDQTKYFAALSRSLDDAPLERRKMIAPRPPVDARPSEFWVTRVETLLRDPYGVYAREVLGLKPLEGFNEPLDHRHVGTLFHKVFELYGCDEAPTTTDEQIAKLVALFEQSAAEQAIGAAHLPFLRERALAAFRWFAQWDAERRAEGAPKVIEGTGKWSFKHDGRVYALKAKADRIDLLSSGAAAIYDYKTGEPPPTDKQQTKFSPQLPLTAAIVEAGGFEKTGAVEVDRFSYLRVQNRKSGSKNETGASGEDAPKMIAEAATGFKDLLSHFNDPNTAYPSQPRPQFIAAYGDYDHLARRRELHAAEGDE